MSGKLKPCPTCGTPEVMRRDYDPDRDDPYKAVEALRARVEELERVRAQANVMRLLLNDEIVACREYDAALAACDGDD